MKWQSQSQWAKSNELLREKTIILLALNLTKAAQSPSWELNMINTYSKVPLCNREMLWQQLQKEIKVFSLPEKQVSLPSINSVKKTPVLQTGKSWPCSYSILAPQPEAVVGVVQLINLLICPMKKWTCWFRSSVPPSHTHTEQLMPAQQGDDK